MSSTFGKLFGGGRPRVQQTSLSPFSQLPQFGQEAFEQGIQQATAVAADPNVFRPSAFVAGEEALLGSPAINIQEEFAPALETFQNPFEEQVVQQSIADLQRGAGDVLASIGSQASSAGAFGGTRQGIAEAELGRTLLEQIGSTSGSLRSQGFQDAADRALSAIGGQAQLDRQRALDLLNLGGLQTQTATAPAEFLLSAAQTLPTAAGTLTPFKNEGLVGRTIGAAGQLGQLASIGAGLGALSDKRAKENITYLRKENGHKIYSFNYKGDKAKYEGVMAQDLLDTMPEAVSMGDDGLYRVNYGMLGVDMRRVTNG